MNDLQRATEKIGEAMKILKPAQKLLNYGGSDQSFPLAIVLHGIEQIYEILRDPECTPEIAEHDEPEFDDGPHYDPDFDPCLWDGDRIDATKSLLFNEALANGELL